MKHNDRSQGPTLGLDVGTSRICVAQKPGEEYQFETQLNAFVKIPYSRMTELALKKEGIPHNVAGPEIVVHGNESDRFAELMNTDTRRSMSRGVLNSAEPESLAMMRQIL